MRTPDYGDTETGVAWRVPLDRVNDWVQSHPERVDQRSRGDRFLRVWKDLWYMLVWVSGGEYDDEIARRAWAAVILRDLRGAPDMYRAYREAEWEVVVEPVAQVLPPVNGEALHDPGVSAPVLIYQFHGCPDVLNVDGVGTTFAIYALDLLRNGLRPQHESCEILSRMVNELRRRNGLRPLRIADGSGAVPVVGEHQWAGMLAETEEGLPVTVRGTGI